MKKTRILAAALSMCVAGFVTAQEAAEFVPSGKVSAKVYTNYTTEFTSENVESVGINLDRAYFGYAYNVSKEFSAEVKLDVGQESSLSAERVAYVKIAAGTYKFSNSTKLDFGLIGLNGFSLQEKAWGYRYIYKAFQDKHKFGNSADLGLLLHHTVSEQIDVDVTIANGEGYKHIQEDLDFLYGFGATIKPTKELTFRLYGDFTTSPNQPSTIASLISIQATEDFRFSAEYDYKMNFKGNLDEDLAGISISTSYDIDKKVSVFARYDKLWSNVMDGDVDPWNASKDGNAVITGLQYVPTKNLKVALNYSGWIYDNKNINTDNIVGVYTEIKF